MKKKQAEKAEPEFFQLLREHKEIQPGDVWKEVGVPLQIANILANIDGSCHAR